jgi:hypothetical protein
MSILRRDVSQKEKVFLKKYKYVHLKQIIAYDPNQLNKFLNTIIPRRIQQNKFIPITNNFSAEIKNEEKRLQWIVSPSQQVVFLQDASNFAKQIMKQLINDPDPDRKLTLHHTLHVLLSQNGCKQQDAHFDLSPDQEFIKDNYFMIQCFEKDTSIGIQISGEKLKTIIGNEGNSI